MSDFLYPFIDADERDSSPLLVDLAASAAGKAETSTGLRVASIEACAQEIARAAAAMAARFDTGGKLFTFGNGGSSTDAATVADLFVAAPGGRALPARTLVDDQAVLTALGNDVGFELIFTRQLIAHAKAGDIAMGISTSGNSDNVIRAFAEAKKRGLLTVGLAGYNGGAMAESADLDHLMVARSESVHRVQESQAALAVELWRQVQLRLNPHREP